MSDRQMNESIFGFFIWNVRLLILVCIEDFQVFNVTGFVFWTHLSVAVQRSLAIAFQLYAQITNLNSSRKYYAWRLMFFSIINIKYIEQTIARPKHTQLLTSCLSMIHLYWSWCEITFSLPDDACHWKCNSDNVEFQIHAKQLGLTESTVLICNPKTKE